MRDEEGVATADGLCAPPVGGAYQGYFFLEGELVEDVLGAGQRVAVGAVGG